VKCRVCKKVLTVAAERKLKRCLTCEVDFDEALFDRLREWRLAEANRASVPAFVIFTDATLQAIAEAEPSNDAGLLAIVGIGQSKLQRYGSAVRLLLDGGSAEDALAASEAATANAP
jgi:DNA helicase-2/ATP-dependent DNA helicase PcrA